MNIQNAVCGGQIWGSSRGKLPRPQMCGCIETRLTGSSDMKRLIHCQWPWWRMTLLHLKPLWIHQGNFGLLYNFMWAKYERIKKKSCGPIACFCGPERVCVCTCRMLNSDHVNFCFRPKQGPPLHYSYGCHSSPQKTRVIPDVTVPVLCQVNSWKQSSSHTKCCSSSLYAVVLWAPCFGSLVQNGCVALFSAVAYQKRGCYFFICSLLIFCWLNPF